MRSEITRRCTPSFALSAAIVKKEKLKDIPPEVEDFFRRIFVVDAKLRAGFSEIMKHPLFK